MPHCFDSLNEVARLSDNELEAYYSANSVEWMNEVIEFLADTRSQNFAISQSSFVGLVREMHRSYLVGSKALGEAIIAAGELEDRSRIREAIAIYVRFIDMCPSKFFREIAQNRLKDLMSPMR